MLENEKKRDKLGIKLGFAGDGYADGYTDIVLSVLLEETNKGLARVFSGAAGATLSTIERTRSQWSRDFGDRHIEFLGDLDGDGCDSLSAHSASGFSEYRRAQFALRDS